MRLIQRHSGFAESGQETAEPVPTWARVCLFYFAYRKSEQMIPVVWNGLKMFLSIQARKAAWFSRSLTSLLVTFLLMRTIKLMFENGTI